MANSSKSPKPSPEQAAVIQAVLGYVARNGTLCALHGAAGTGKTFTCGFIAQELLRLYLEKSVFFVSPTHAALRILRQKIPKGVKASTVARFLRTEPYRDFDEIKFELPDSSEYQQIADHHFKYLLEGSENLKVVVCDESSMISQPQADALRGVCAALDVTFMMVGDPYQLPPVLTDAQRKRLMSRMTAAEMHDDVVYSRDMCKEFRLPSVGFQLTEVHRNTGAILKKAVSIRNDFRNKNHQLPSKPELDSEFDGQNATGIYVTSDYCDFVQNLAEAVCESKDGLDVAAICHHNKSVMALTMDLRSLLYPASFKTNWNAGEYVLLPNQTCRAPAFTEGDEDINAVDWEGWDTSDSFYSTTYCEVTRVETGDKNFYFGSWPLGNGTEYEFKLKGCFQRIALKACHFGGTLSIYRPIFTDGQPLADFKEAKKAVRIMQKNGTVPKRGETGFREHPVGKILLCMESFFSDINCANTMTVHKSQGCTLRVAYIHEDVGDCKRHYRNPLLYTSLTRASHQEVVLNTASTAEALLPRWEIGRHQLALPPSERKPPKVSEQEIGDLLDL